jgi:hypothetical protein
MKIRKKSDRFIRPHYRGRMMGPDFLQSGLSVSLKDKVRYESSKSRRDKIKDEYSPALSYHNLFHDIRHSYYSSPTTCEQRNISSGNIYSKAKDSLWKVSDVNEPKGDAPLSFRSGQTAGAVYTRAHVRRSYSAKLTDEIKKERKAPSFIPFLPFTGIFFILFIIFISVICASAVIIEPFVYDTSGISSAYYSSDEKRERLIETAVAQEGITGGRKFWTWYGFKSRVEWCACFVSWCADSCGLITDGSMPKFAGCVYGTEWFKQKGRWLPGDSAPSPGDIIFFDWDLSGDADHVGIVTAVDRDSVHTVEGNNSDACRSSSYPIGSSYILGYGIIL